jgi:polysaccharide biosynthesis/export protein
VFRGENMHKPMKAVTVWIMQSLAVLIFPTSSEASEYRLGVGDVLELSIIGSPEVRQRIPVDIDGDASFPLIGEMQVAGITMSDLRSRVVERLPHFIYKNRSASIGDQAQVIEANEISLRILEYRPVYLSGDVARQGEVSYRPGLNVRQAISVAGGYNVEGSTPGNSALDVLETQNQYATVAINLARETVRIWRLQSTLNPKISLDRSELDASVNLETLNRLIELEVGHREAEQRDYEAEKTQLLATIEQAEWRMTNLSNQSKSEAEGAKLDADEVEKVNDLFRRSLVPSSRVTDVRRAALLSSSRALQTSVAADNARKERDEAQAKLARLSSTRYMELARELLDATAKEAVLRAEFDNMRKKLLLAGVKAPSLLRAPNASVRVVIFRRIGNDEARIVAEQEAELLPGDVVEVSLGLSSPESEAHAQSSIKAK